MHLIGWLGLKKLRRGVNPGGRPEAAAAAAAAGLAAAELGPVADCCCSAGCSAGWVVAPAVS